MKIRLIGVTQMFPSEPSVFATGIRPAIDKYLEDKSKEVRDYGDYWSASSAGYCMRKVIFDRMRVTPTSIDARKTRVFEVGHIFHEWIQRITKDSGISIAQEIELQDEQLMVRGHIDDLVLINDNLILYDFKTAHSRSFTFKKGKPMSHYHTMQLGTYMYMLRKGLNERLFDYKMQILGLTEGRILTISKDDLRMDETVLMWNDGLNQAVTNYWTELNGYWNAKKLPVCTCAEYEKNDRTGIGFMADSKYNPYYFQGEPCSLTWYKIWKEGKANEYLKEA